MPARADCRRGSVASQSRACSSQQSWSLSCSLLGCDSGCLDDLRLFLDVCLDERVEILERQKSRDDSRLQEFLVEIWRLARRIQSRGEPVEDRCRGAGRRKESEPGAVLVSWDGDLAD